MVAGSKIVCASCGDRFIGRRGTAYCSGRCKQAAHRSRRGASRNASRNAASAAPVRNLTPEPGEGHSAEALALLRALDEEMAENSADLGLTEDAPLGWSAAERAIRELIASEVDRKVDLGRRLEASGDDKVRVKLGAEHRLTTANIARLLKQISTEPPPAAPSLRSRKASHAARVRWNRGAS
jgi:hypothetical protein